MWRGTKDFSHLIGASFTDPKKGRFAWTNQSSSHGPLRIKLSLTSNKRIETWLAVQIPAWGRLRKRWKMLLRPRAILNRVTIKGKQSKHICREGMFLCLLQPELARVWLLSWLHTLLVFYVGTASPDNKLTLTIKNRTVLILLNLSR